MPFAYSWKRGVPWSLAFAILMMTVFVLVQRDTPPRASAIENLPSTRYISLVPSITSTLLELDAQGVLVGRSDWCDDSEVLQHVPTMGSMFTPNLEAIAMAQPATLLVDGSSGASLAPLAAIAPVEALPWLTAAEVAASVRVLGDRLGLGASADRLAQRFDTLAEAEAPDAAPRVLLVLQGSSQPGQVWYIRPDSLHGEALTLAGYWNAVSDAISGPPMLSLEGLLELAPDAVVLLGGEAIDPREQRRWLSDWAKITPLPAVADGNIAVLAGPNVLATGPQVLRLAERLDGVLQGMNLAAP